MDELSNEILERAFLYRLLVEYRPDVVIDCINTATAFAYQDVFYSVRKVQAAVADVDAGASDAGALRDAIEDHLTTLLAAAADPPRSDPAGGSRGRGQHRVPEGGHDGERWDGPEHSLHALRGAAQPDPPLQVVDRGSALDAPVPAGENARSTDREGDQARRRDRMEAHRRGTGPSPRSSDPALRLPTGARARRRRGVERCGWTAWSELLDGSASREYSNPFTSTPAKTACSLARSSRRSPRWVRWST